MSEETTLSWDRREWIAGAALLAMFTAATGNARSLERGDPSEAPTDRQRRLMRDVSDIVIPRTDTPGAADVAVGDFVILALAHGLGGSRAPAASAAITQPGRMVRADGSLRHLVWLEEILNQRARGAFLTRAADERRSIVARLDADVFGSAQGHPWKTIKALILDGYYTTKAGGSRELRYELVPGRWDPDVPLKPGDRAFSSDWTAVDFG